ncbi:hypothetical protein JTE90_015117 [Oedothorax gibbosus]|uniref:RNA-dependent RNA polymerase n=1 Tax=Oedothorax gibbosus TaxID=931172 RepID=A0AAV6VS21_9ARAC|nr:hypothetical protein JTE90_015117 [Oedothorax gibbosus]
MSHPQMMFEKNLMIYQQNTDVITFAAHIEDLSSTGVIKIGLRNRKMLERNFKFIVRFLNEQNNYDEYVSQAKSFFDSLEQQNFQHSIIFGDAYKTMDEFSCDSELYEIPLTITCTDVKRESDVQNFASATGRQWCDKARNNIYLHWLLPEKGNLFSTNYNNHYGSAKVSEFAFGTMPNMKDFIQCYRFQERGYLSDMLCSYSHLERNFVLYISNTHKRNCAQTDDMGYKIMISYDSLIRIVTDTDTNKESAEFYLHMEHTPLIYVCRPETKPPVAVDSQADFNAPKRVSKAKELELGSDRFERTFQMGCQCNHTFCDNKIHIGKAPVLKIVIPDKFQARWLVEQLILRRAKKTEVCFTSMKMLKIPERPQKAFPWPLRTKIPEQDKFSCDYAWKVICSRSLAIFHEISLKDAESPGYAQKVWKDLSDAAVKNPSAVAKALFHIADMVDKGILFPFKYTFQKKFTYFCHFVELNKLPKGMCYVRRVIITPSKVIFRPPYEHFDNRIVRKFGVEYMLRVSIQDDNFSKLTYAVQYNSKKQDITNKVVYQTLLNGLQVGSRHYEVLAASTSQLREHGLWMYASDPNRNNAWTIRKWMGDFSGITNVAKYMARMGQCLSTTEEGVHVCLDSNSEIVLKEFKSDCLKYIFSDGIGVISSSLADEVRTALTKNQLLSLENPSCYQPSAFQIRYKGCKGMVVEWQRPGRAIGIRPSMKKFECNTSDNLEIVKTSAPRKLYLNKHLITILEQMGIPKETFFDLQSNMMLHLLDSLMQENLAASLLLHNISLYFPFKDMHQAGFSITTEPFFRSLLLSVFKSLAENLRSSMRVEIPEEYGRNMLGVLDETKTLKYGEVFVQYTESTSDPNSRVKILKGPVVVTKNPTLHPGDVRRLMAVDNPDLRHIKDCVVFPAQGPRPHPDEMAGSDLDGDEFVVLWYKPLIFKRQNYPPMDYPVYEETSRKDKINLEDMIEFFCLYIQNDNIGSFAHAHLVWADLRKNGIFSTKCMKIAERYPYVLDFAKHGATEHLNKSSRPDQYPDFMQKGLIANSYHSKRALGSLYRSSRVLDACSSKINLSIQSVTVDPDLNYPGWEKYEESAERHRKKYVSMIQEILQRYNLQCETEAITGVVELEVSKKWRHELADVAKVVKSYLQNIMMTFKNIFTLECQDEVTKCNLNDSDSKECKFQRASAWYMVVYGKGTSVGLSFPWVLSDILVDLKFNRCVQVTRENLLFADLDDGIQQCIISGSLELHAKEGIECLCWSTTKAILLGWISKARLNIWSLNEAEACNRCFDRIMSHFQSDASIICCSTISKNTCTCSESCLPSKLVLHALKFFVKYIKDSIGSCSEGCDGFIPRNLQELSLQTLAYLAITRNISYLGLQYEVAGSATIAADDLFEEEEGDPIKIPVKTDILKNIVERFREKMMAYLKKSSGVKRIFFVLERDLRGNLSLIVHSSGKNWQRWNLQEILLDPNLTQKLVTCLGLTANQVAA